MQRRPFDRVGFVRPLRSRKEAPWRRRRLHVLEQLEARALLSADGWHNTDNYLDVNADGLVSPVDALVVINDLNQNGARSLDQSGDVQAMSSLEGVTPPTGFVDVNGDRAVSARDALMVVNAMNGLDGTDKIQITLHTTDLAGNDISQIQANTDFFLVATAEDLRGLPESQAGVFAVYLDVVYGADHVTIENSMYAPVFEGVFVNGTGIPQDPTQIPDPPIFSPNNPFATDGLIDELGAFSGSLTPLGNGVETIWRVFVHADSAGTVNFAPNFPDLQGHEILLYKQDSAVPEADVDFVGTTLTIVDPPLVPATVAIDNVTKLEGDSGTNKFEFTVSISNNLQNAIVSFNTTDGTAISSGATRDFNGIVSTPLDNTQRLTFVAGGALTQKVTVQVRPDTAVEPDETFFLNLIRPHNVTLADAQGVGTILDDDAPSVSIADAQLVEGNGGTTSMFFNLTLDKTSTSPLTVVVTTSDGTATAGTDYLALTQTVTFGTGELQKQVAVTINGDTTAEPDETFFVDLSNVSGGHIADGHAVGTITNDDGGGEFSIANVSQAEGSGGGTTDFVFTVTLSQALGAQATVAFATADDTATTADGDYTAQSGTLTFAPGDTTKQITIHVAADTRNENDETFTVGLSSPTGATLSANFQALGTITNDDAVPSLTIADATITEGNSGTSPLEFAVTLSAASGKQVIVVFNTADGTAHAPADYTAQSGTLTFAPGETTHTISVPVVGDALSEGNETFTVNLLTANNATIGDDQATGTINDNEAVPTLSIGDVSLNEGNSGTTNFSFTVTLSGASAQNVTVAFLAVDGTATAPSDYAVTNGTLTFAPGETSKQIVVPVVGDTTTEPDEQFTVVLGSPSGATIADGSGTGTITNDDGVPAIDVTDVTLAEGNSSTTDFTFTVSLSFLPEQEVTVVYATADGTATTADSDYAATSGTLTFAPGEGSKTVTVAVNGDTLNEANETFFLNLSNPHNAFFAQGGNQGQGTITNDDPQPSLSINDALVTEGSAPNTVNATFTVTLSTASGQAVTVVFATANGTATAPGDYVAQAGTLTFAAGETSKTISVVVNGDATDEIDESFFVNLSAATNAEIADGQGVGTITDDDPQPAVSIAAPQLAPNEGNSGTTNMVFTVSLSAASGKEITVAFATANVTAFAPGDYTATSGTLTLAPGETTKTISVPIVGDTLDEPNETFTVTLSSSTNADLGTAVATGTITDDDAPPTVSIADNSVTEGNSGNANLNFNVTLSAASGQTVTVVATTADGTAGQPGDYAAKTETLTFAPGETSKTFTVAVVGDTIDEGASETFRVNLSAPTNATIADGEATGTITDEDNQPSITIGDVSLAEGNSGTTNFDFSVTLSNASSSTVTVAFATADGTAHAPRDYTSTTGALTFAPGEISKTITVAVKGDTFQEQNETFNVNLSSATNATIADPQGVGTINNDGDTGAEPVKVRGLVFIDTDNDGNRDTNINNVNGNDEKGLSGAIVKLAGTTESGDPVDRQATSGDDGSFEFADVTPGTYTITETQPAAYLDGIDTAGTGGTTTTNDVINLTLAGGADSTGHRFGERGLRPEFVSKRLFLASANLNGTISALSTQEGPAFLALDAGWEGTLTARANGSAAGTQPTLTLLDNNLHVLASSARVNGEARLDYNGSLGVPYFIKVSGSNPAIDVTLTNAVIQDGQTVTVRGTEGDDTFEFTAGTKNAITINGTSYSFTPAEANSFNFEGRGGHDTVKFNGSAGADNATLGLGYGTMSGTGYRVSAQDMASIVVDGGGGNDTATLLDSAGNDHLSGAANWLSLSNDDGLVSSLVNFETVRVKSTGGHDTKLLGAIDFVLQQEGTWFDE